MVLMIVKMRIMLKLSLSLSLGMMRMMMIGFSHGGGISGCLMSVLHHGW